MKMFSYPMECVCLAKGRYTINDALYIDSEYVDLRFPVGKKHITEILEDRLRYWIMLYASILEMFRISDDPQLRKIHNIFKKHRADLRDYPLYVFLDAISKAVSYHEYRHRQNKDNLNLADYEKLFIRNLNAEKRKYNEKHGKVLQNNTVNIAEVIAEALHEDETEWERKTRLRKEQIQELEKKQKELEHQKKANPEKAQKYAQLIQHALDASPEIDPYK